MASIFSNPLHNQILWRWRNMKAAGRHIDGVWWRFSGNQYHQEEERKGSMAILLGYVVDVAQGSIQKVTLELMVGRRSLPFGARVFFSGANLLLVFGGVRISDMGDWLWSRWKRYTVKNGPWRFFTELQSLGWCYKSMRIYPTKSAWLFV